MAIADRARQGLPSASIAASSAKAFMTVASMPMESARARSMPLSAPWMPRKKLPPPTTTAISTLCAALAKSAATRLTDGASKPWLWPPISASPDNFTITRFQLCFILGCNMGHFRLEGMGHEKGEGAIRDLHLDVLLTN